MKPRNDQRPEGRAPSPRPRARLGRVRRHPPSPAPPREDAARQLESLRRLLVGPEQERLSRIEAGPFVSADNVGTVLPEAVARTTAVRRDELVIALEPAVSGAVRQVARNSPEIFGEALAPTIGAAVKRAVGDAIAAMLQRLNETMERSLSLQSIRWRLEARRTGRPFAEVVLLRTLVYRVEQVFLVHSESGLLLHHAAVPDAGVQSPDQVASMLTAIGDFVREAFRPVEPGVHLRELHIGELAIWVERDSWLTIAAVIRGHAPREYATVLQEARERIFLQHQADLARFHADISPFAPARRFVEGCLTEQRTRPRQRAHVVLLAVAAVLVGLIAFSLVRSHLARGARADVVARIERALESEPGLVVTSARRVDGRYRVDGFRDPLAAEPQEVLARHGLPAAELRLQPLLSFDPQLISRRATQALRPPEGVVLQARAAVLSASGTAPRRWIERARLLAPVLPGVQAYDDHALHPEDTMARLRAMATAVRGLDVRFPRGRAEPEAGQSARIVRVASLLRRLTVVARETGLVPCTAVIGHADGAGAEAENRKLSELRAERVAAALRSRGLDPDHLRPSGAGVWRERRQASEARSVTFDVTLPEADQAGAGCGAVP